MIRIKPITLDDGSQILVEVEQAEVPAAASQSDLPADAMQLMRHGIAAMARNVRESLAGESPDEWTMELGVGFKGEDRPIPVIVTGASTGSVKVTAKWKRGE
jgi:chemotaxis response regulator CheB